MLAQQFFEQPHLLLSHLDEFRPFLVAQPVEFFVQGADFQLTFEIDFVIVRRVDAGVFVERISRRDLEFCQEVFDLCDDWLKTRRAPVKFGWLFEVAPFRHAERKKFFAARRDDGRLVGLLAASPIPARGGWYLEDVLRRAGAPRGTTDLLVYEALKTLQSEGAKLATLGTSPLAADGANQISDGERALSKKILEFSRANFGSLYNFDGLRHFKGKFAPDWWESEYALVPKGFFVPPRVANAFARAVLPNLLPLVTRRRM